MIIKNKFKCNYCGVIIEEDTDISCCCGKIKIVNGVLISESVSDYKDVTPRLIVE